MCLFELHLRPLRASSILVAASALALPSGAFGQQQSARIRVEENFRADPRGAILGRLQPGILLRVVSEEDSWVQVELEGWIWSPSLQATDNAEFDLEVAVEEGENLRAQPQGDLLGFLATGTLLDQVDATESWRRVRRVGWVWRPSVEVTTGGRPQEAPTPSAPSSQEGLSDRFRRSGSVGTPILSGPDGDTLAQSLPGTEIEVLSRQGNWARVRLEGWIWDPTGALEADSLHAPTRTDATPAEVSEDPDAYRGSVVSWDLQFISIERAERIRTDFYEGEPFLLARSEPSHTFVYVAIPPERLPEAEGLIPLEMIRVVGRVRTGAAALTGNPILDLLDLERDLRN
jgi:hypothetical protein